LGVVLALGKTKESFPPEIGEKRKKRKKKTQAKEYETGRLKNGEDPKVYKKK